MHTTPIRAPKRAAERTSVRLPGRLTWKDSRGTTRFASVTTRDVSDHGVFIECVESASIPLYRLVTFQLEREARHLDCVPEPLRTGKVLSAVFRVGAVKRATGTPEGYGLRLLIEPGRHTIAAPERPEAVGATA